MLRVHRAISSSYKSAPHTQRDTGGALTSSTANNETCCSRGGKTLLMYFITCVKGPGLGVSKVNIGSIPAMKGEVEGFGLSVF